MKDKFKTYLLEKFRQIAPTKNAMEFRNKMLKQLMDRAQELSIKGITDEELIYNICIEELGDFDKTLAEFDNQVVKTNDSKRKATVIVASVIASIVALVLTYLIVGTVTKIWHPTWLILVGGIFVGIIGGSSIFIFSKKKGNLLIKRLLIVVDLSLLVTFIFLIMQLATTVVGAWQIYLVLPILILAVDTTISFLVKNKIRWFELPIFVEVFAVMLYVLLGVNISTVWHPGWLLCLAGPLCAVIEIAVFASKKAKADKIKEDSKNFKQYEELNEHYYTDWDD